MRNSKTFLRLSIAAVAATLWTVGTVGTAQASPQLLQFETTPVSPGLPEFSWTGPSGNYVPGNGSLGNGDGNLTVASQTPGGIQVDTPLVVTAPATAGEVIDSSGSHFFDVTLAFSSTNDTSTLKDNGAYVLLNTSLNLAVQTLTDGTFTMTATDGTLLLSGSFHQNSFTVPLSSTSAGFQSAQVSYTGGLIYNALTAIGGKPNGSASISMTTLDGPIVANYTGPGTGVLLEAPATINAFDANATGVFDVAAIPEPASIGLLAIGGLLGLRRRRSN